MANETKQTKRTVHSLRTHKCASGKEPLVVVTAYDYSFARLLGPASDVVLVGDSAGMVMQGQKSTLPVTLDQMVYHTQCVARGLQGSTAHLVADLPFLSYQADISQAVLSAGRLLAEGGAESVKLEGGTVMAKTIERLVQIGIPVMAHIGMTPQSVMAFGGFRVQGRSEAARKQILQDALAVEAAGAYSVVLEAIPTDLAAEITAELKIPTIGIGAGAKCDGQVLVMHDLLGLNIDFQPKFVKRYAELAQVVTGAVQSFAREVRGGEFPRPEHSYDTP